MDILVISIINVLWVFYSISEGMRSAAYKANKEISKWDIGFDYEKMFNIQRSILLSIITTITLYIIGYEGLLFIIGHILIFKYLSKISYNKTYNNLKNIESESKNKDKKKTMIALGVSIQIITYFLL